MTKKIWSLVLVLALMLGGVSVAAAQEASPFAPIALGDIKVGCVLIGPMDDGFSGAHYNGIELMKETIGLSDDQILYKFNVDETADCEIALRELLDKGCNIIFGNSWGYMDYMAELADEYPDVVFSHCSGYKSNDRNFNNYFGRIYQVRYLAGIAAGLKTKTNKIGFVAAHPDNAEVNGGINAFALGIQSVNPEAQVYVKYVHNWSDPTLEKQTAEALLALDCDVIGQHCDSALPQVAAQEAGKYGCGYNTDMTIAAPDAHLTAPVWNWGVIYIDQVQKLIAGTWQPENYYWGLQEGLVGLSPLSANVAEGTAEKIEEARARILSGEWDVFTGPLYDNQGNQVLAEGETLPVADIVSGKMTTLLVKGVENK